jgi:hypothetical protein
MAIPEQLQAAKSAGIFAERKTKGTASAVPFVYRVNLSRVSGVYLSVASEGQARRNDQRE